MRICEMNHEEQDGDRCTEEVSVSLKEQGSKFYDVLRTEVRGKVEGGTKVVWADLGVESRNLSG